MIKWVHALVSKLYRGILDARRCGGWLRFLSPMGRWLGYVKERMDAALIRSQRYRDKGLLRAMHARVLTTAHSRCNAEATVEVHTLTAHHHLRMYLTAIKSLLRFYDDVAVVVHDDGSLNAEDAVTLRDHVRGIRIIKRASADAEMQSRQAACPASRRLRDKVVNALEVFDNILLARTERLVNLNSDVLFLSEPTELVEWIAKDDRSIAGVYEKTPAKQKDFLAAFGCPFPPHVTTALACLPRDIFDASFVEDILSRAESDWFTAQNVYPLLYHHQGDRHRVRFFDEDRYQSSGVFREGAAFRHYWTSTGWFSDLQACDSKRVLDALGAQSR
jgi:hypothetical protein